MSDKKTQVIELIKGDLPRADIVFLTKMHYKLEKHINDPISNIDLETRSIEERIENFLNNRNTISSKNTKSNYRSVLNNFLKSSYPDITDIKILDYG